MVGRKIVKCVYHAADLDGFCSGALVGHIWGWDNIEFIPMDHGWGFPWDSFGPNDTVCMVDFALQPFTLMRQLNKQCGRLIWIDHHKSSIEEEEEWARDNPDLYPIEGIREVGKAGCELVWECLRGNHGPKAVYLLGRYDVWDWKDVEGALQFNMGMRAYGDSISPKNCVQMLEYRALWDQLFLDDDNAHYRIEQIIRHGATVLRYSSEENKKAAKSACFQTTISGVPVIAANVGGKNSQFFDAVLDDFPEAKALMTFHYRRGKWNISLYQIEGRGTPDLSIIATDLGLRSQHGGGGGGHAGAAGFQWHCWGAPFEVHLQPKPLEKGSD